MVKCKQCNNSWNMGGVEKEDAQSFLDLHLKNHCPGKKNDPVHHPQHYTEHPSGVECITITEHMNFNVGNAVKYLWRADLKNGLEDLKKAAWYINREIARRGE